MKKENVEAVYSLSPMQQGMLFHTLYAPESGVYFEQLTCKLNGILDVAAFQQAWQRVVQQHSALRTSFVWKRLEKTLQVVHKEVTLPFTVKDWCTKSPVEQEMLIEKYLQDDRARGFDLSAAPLMRLALVHLREHEWQFIWSHHHILMDGWSLHVLLREVFTLYEIFHRGEEPLPGRRRSYREYIDWLQRQDLSRAESFWTRTLEGFVAPTPLPRRVHSAGTDDRCESYTSEKLVLSERLTSELVSLSRREKVTLNTIMQCAWAILLSRTGGGQDIVFGTTVSGRPPGLEGVEDMIGVFINTLPLRINVTTGSSLIDLCKELQLRQIEMREFEFTPLVQIQGWTAVPRGVPLFETILVFENYPVDASLMERRDGLRISSIRSFSRTNFPLTFVVAPTKEMALEIAYETKCFDASSVRSMLENLRMLLESFAAHPVTTMERVSLLNPTERERIIREWNDTSVDFPESSICVHEWFEMQALQSPDACAVDFEGVTLSYRELNERANQLAHYLRGMGVGPDTLVGLCVERSLEMVVCILGVLKAGGAYVPIDPALPQNRLAFMLEDSATGVLLTQANLLNDMPHRPDQTILVDADWGKISASPNTNPSSNTCAESLAYVIYTSGSTGTPKGALLQHNGLCNLVRAQVVDWKITSQSHVLQFASLSFDASVSEIFTALLCGATLHLARKETTMSQEDLHRYLAEHSITILTAPPSLLSLLPQEGLPALRTVVSAGEDLSWEIAHRWCQGRDLFNAYGPTESTIAATWHLVRERPDGATTVPIGRPFANVQMYVLDPFLNPVPVHVPGEVYIGGRGLARGYLHRADLTAGRFIPDPFGDKPGARLYRTGDLARYLSDGSIEFLGRTDHQVKVRGFRIELGEIEARLNDHASVEQAVVIVRQDTTGEKQLVAYVVFRTEKVPTAGDLLGFLRASLPEYMIPAAFVLMDKFPLTPNGKVDRTALPAPDEQSRVDSGNLFVAPRNTTEQLLADIWKTILGIERVGVHDSFFELGGHSLRATQMLSRIREVFSLELPLRTVFDSPTLADLAQKVDLLRKNGDGNILPPIRKSPRDENMPLSFAQQRLWFLEQLAPGGSSYNIPAALHLMGKLDIPALEQCLTEIVRRHETLRTTFADVNGTPAQVIGSPTGVRIPFRDLSNLALQDREAEQSRLTLGEARQPFDLAKGPLFRTMLIRVSPEDHVALLTMHHIIADGWSMGVLVEEIAALYKAYVQGESTGLAELSIQYADYALWQRLYLQGEALDHQISYWKKQLEDIPAILELPADRPRPPVQTFRGSTRSLVLSQDVSAELAEFCRQEGVTLFMALLAAFQTLLYRYTSQKDIVVGSPIANRTNTEAERLIGFFVNTLALRARFHSRSTFRAILHQVRTVCLEAFAHQDVPFEKLVEQLQPARVMSHSPVFQVAFVLQNAPFRTLQLPDLVVEPLSLETGTAKIDMTLTMVEQPDGLLANMEYNTDLFDDDSIVRMLDHFQTLLFGVLADPESPVCEIPLMSEQESRKVLVEWNSTSSDFPHDSCVHEWFERRAHEHPDAIAVAFGTETVSYGELNRRSNQLAHHLHSLGIGPEKLVGIFLERSVEMIVGMVATLKAGGAFVPLDPAYPSERLSFMIEDSGISILLLQKSLSDLLPVHGIRKVFLDAEWGAVSCENDSTPVAGTTPDNLAYVIYTSGSTGKPKGAMLHHRGLCNLATQQIKYFRVGPGSRILQFSSLSFDASVWETVMALLSGSTLVLVDREMLSTGQGLLETLRERNITNVTLPPSVLAVVPGEPLPCLETIITAGEKCPQDLVARWSVGRSFFDAYGPTETTVCATMLRVEGQCAHDPPIGRPIGNTSVYLLDENLQPVPVGVPGELHIGGIGLARGYLKRTDLTAEKFIPNPYAGRGARLYKTGDLARYLPDGNIEFLGRIDTQVKVRGFRIELGEIESILDTHPAVCDAAAVVREDTPGDKRVVAYLVSRRDPKPGIEELRAFLRKRLPEYMLPSAFVFVGAMPLSPSGKIDRKALPPPDTSRPDLDNVYVAPRNQVEERLTALCAELLGLERVGVNDNFFDLGGHSLLATQLMSRVRTTFHRELPLRALFETPTVAGLAERINMTEDVQQAPMEQIAEKLKNIEQLSESEVKAMLEELR